MDYSARTGNTRRIAKSTQMRVVQIWRYPVKALGGEPLRSTRLAPGGIPHDRGMVIADPNPARAGKPLNGTIEKRLMAFCARVRDGITLVAAPDGTEYRVDDRRWLAELARVIERPAELLPTNGPLHDDSDVLVISAASLRQLETEYGASVNPLQFRPNIILDGPDMQAFEEEAWAGGELSIGDAVLTTTSACLRCVVTTINPETLTSDPAFLKLQVRLHGARFGMYGNVIQPGEIKIGDIARVRRATEVGT